MDNLVDHAEKIRLRAPEPEDLDVMFQMENGNDLWSEGIATGPYSRYQLKKYIEENQNDLFSDRQLRLMIEHEELGVAGIIDICTFEPRHMRGEVGLFIWKDFRGRGIARVALNLLERHCFHVLGLHQLYAYIRKGNTACLNLFKSEGYEQVGILRSWFYMKNGFQDVCLVQKINDLVE